MNEVLRNLADTDMALRVPLADVQQIEASAGTGKTYTIAGLYARLVVERNLETRQILVMTFTKAATEELRQRLRQRLAVCARVAAQPWIDSDAALPDTLDGEQRWALALLRRTLECGEEAPSDLAHRLQQAVTRMDEAAIFTIHGFCQRVLGEHAALIEGVSETRTLEPSDDDLLASFAADAWLRWGSAEDIVDRHALLTLGSTPEALATTLKPLIDFHGRIEPLPSPDADAMAPCQPEDVDAAREALHRIWSEAGEEAVAVFRAAFEAGHLHGGRYKSDSVEGLRDLHRQLAEGGRPAPNLLQKFAGEKLAAAVKKNKPPFAGHAAFTAIDDWLRAESAYADQVRARTPVVLHALLREAREGLAARKRDLSRLSYADQIEWVHRGLDDGARGERLRQALHAQYPVALVDEFQDTDARQFEIFRRLYAEQGVLFCIGDPKQAIYGFRGGDVHAYLRAKRLAAAHWSLDHNYRSAAGLLTACEALFSGREDVFVEDGIAFESVQSGGKEADGALRRNGEQVAPMTLWRLPDEAPPGGREALEESLALACAGEVARLLTPETAQLREVSVAPGSIAVLVDSNRQAMRVQDALAACGVPAVCQRRESVYATQEAVELCRILDALLAPRHAGLARGALCTRLLGRRLGDLRTMQDHDADWRDELDDLRARWLERGVLAMLERLGERHARRLLAEPDGERCLSNLMQLGDALQAEARRLSSARAQRDWLARRMALADAGNENEQLRLESDAERVQIMTVHASKGLEFDLVLLPFAALMQARKPEKGGFARYHDGDDLVRRFIASGSGDRDPDDDEAMAAAQREELAEGVRKLYVGVTRARHSCWLSVPASGRTPAGSVLGWVLADGVEALLARGGASVAEAPLPEPVHIGVAPPAQTPQLQARRFQRELDRDWRHHSFSRLAEGGHSPHFDTDASAASATDADARVPAMAGGLHGSRFGSAVHDALEHIDFAAWADDAGAVPDTQREIVMRALAAQGFSGAAAQRSVEDLLRRTLRTPVVDDLCLAALPESMRRAEMVFDFGMEGADPQQLLDVLHVHGYQLQRERFAHVGGRLRGLMNGIIDLVFVHADRWWIADYKTNHLGDRVADYAPEPLRVAVHDSDYDLQYLIYTVALHRWLRQLRGDDYDYARDFGGVRYLFLRGMGVGPEGNGIHADRPPPELVFAMDALLRAPGGRS
ncbi:exodeoxyribonuclease V subunit beta [Oleiagrimonas sp. MCCC 1A03011]|uniref:exodeoxyribonuclease V subunit beta n=1 Tax=Oleiagrimonas sp. MCCC 1A03011 TaxID=1926883 RepID=UPI000DC2802C|nr:exodeoxyribonuclease V subunit beta [Oleiagrimonas sp. MCCC 1A03011]RAP56254.1 exodeoxyribonuclease V subunit beta [Oleiagrimonas sp. MCCC 1A03011]